MHITALGHAGLKIEIDAATLLIDPWLSPEGAFDASWFQFPDNSHLIDAAIFRPTAIALSHEHLDHTDPWFLAQVPSDVPVYIPRYPSPVLRRKILAAGNRPIIELPAWEPAEVANRLRLFFVSEESPMNHDSAVVVEAGGKTLLDLNDARLFPVQFRAIRHRVGGSIDAFSFQGAGASWYPMCYEYPPEQRRALAVRKRLAKLAYTARSIEVIEPGVALPFGGPPCFLDERLNHHNNEMDGGIFPHQEDVADWLLERGVQKVEVLLPGDSWDVEANGKIPDPTWEGFSFADRARYLSDYAGRRRRHIDSVLSRRRSPSSSLYEPFKDYFERLLSVSPYFNRRIGMRVGFEIRGPGGGNWSVDFRPGSEGVHPEMRECGYVYRFDSRWLPPILEGITPWEDFLLSLRFEARRNPDLYNDHLLGLLKFAEEDALQAVEEFETALGFDERITVNAGGKTYSVSRYCPHAGNDLSETGEVLPGGILRCLAHHYEFDLETGRCVNGSCQPLDVEAAESLNLAGA